jgi:hypothetical protein
MRSLFFGLVMFAASYALAQTADPSPPAIYRMSREDFLKAVGSDDTLRAVVNLYYRKRKTASTLITVGAASLGVFVVGSVFTVLRSAGRAGSNDPADDITTFAQVTSAVFYAGTISGAVRLIRYQRKQLQRIIADRQAGKPLPDRVRRKLKAEDFSN